MIKKDKDFHAFIIHNKKKISAASCYNFAMKIATWDEFFKIEASKLYFTNMLSFIEHSYKLSAVYPERANIFKAFELTKLADVKVVILGQDPYHQKDQAMGLAFSVPRTVKVPPSLVNVFKELKKDLDLDMDFTNGDLTYLAKQGVLLFNPIFTVEDSKPLSHNIPEYKQLTISIFSTLSQIETPIVFILWGAKAHKMEKYITNKNHLVIKTAHPSPLAANRGGFFGLHQFSRTNDFLTQHGLLPIQWQNK